MTAGGPLTIQALAGLAEVNNDTKAYGDACLLNDRRSQFNFNWFPLCDDTMTCIDLSRAAKALGKTQDAQAFLGRARAAGWVQAQGANW